MKRTLPAIAAALAALTLSACSSTPSSAPVAQKAKAAPPSTAPAPTTSEPPATAPPTVPPSTAPPPPPTTTTAPPSEPYISIPGTESTLSGIAAEFGDSLGWHYDKSQGQTVGTTGDDFCEIDIVNSEGEASNLADNVTFSCGLPDDPSAVTHADTQEEALFTTTLVGQDVGTPAVQWLASQVDAGGAPSEQTFTGPLGPIQVSVNDGDGQSSIGLLTGY
jgi:hypothetical protein